MRRHRISRPYVLSVASAERNKNLPALIEAFSTACLGAKGGWQLVLTGRAGGGEREIREALGRNGIEDRVVMTGFVPDEDLPALYSGSEIFAFPSLYEGFGLPPVEALACGTAVLCSNAASLPEVVGDAGLLADPTPESFADGLETLMGDEKLRSALRVKGLSRAREFSWEASAKLLLGVIETTVG